MWFQIKHLVVHYQKAEILKGVSLAVEQGDIVTLIGSNGAGKTTTIRTISGLKQATSGEIWFEGQRIDHLPPQHIVRLGIVQVPAGRGLFPYMTVNENLKLGAYPRKDKRSLNASIEKMYASFPILYERSNQLAGTLSGGQQQILAIAAAMMAAPKLLLLDEPSTGLSPLMVGEIGRVILDINKGNTSVLLVEQNAQMAFRLAGRGYVMETGAIVVSGPTAELKTNQHVQKAYLGI
jgi:branched-chain amino acid transport system ATP-binding protein